MKRYQLPEVLGGGTYESVGGYNREPVSPALVGLKVDGCTVWVPKMLLTEAEPPLPPEPRNFSTVRVGSTAYVRDDDRYLDGDGAWHGPGKPETWEALCRAAMDKTGYPPVVLVPDPLGEPVELPWRDQEYEVDVAAAVGCACHGQADGERLIRVGVGEQSTTLPVAVARVMARALLSAADKEPELPEWERELLDGPQGGVVAGPFIVGESVPS